MVHSMSDFNTLTNPQKLLRFGGCLNLIYQKGLGCGGLPMGDSFDYHDDWGRARGGHFLMNSISVRPLSHLKTRDHNKLPFVM